MFDFNSLFSDLFDDDQPPKSHGKPKASKIQEAAEEIKRLRGVVGEQCPSDWEVFDVNFLGEVDSGEIIACVVTVHNDECSPKRHISFSAGLDTVRAMSNCVEAMAIDFLLRQQ